MMVKGGAAVSYEVFNFRIYKAIEHTIFSEDKRVYIVYASSEIYWRLKFPLPKKPIFLNNTYVMK